MDATNPLPTIQVLGPDDPGRLIESIAVELGFPIGTMPWRWVGVNGDPEHPVIAVLLAEPIGMSVEHAAPKLIDLWERWPSGVPGEMVLGGRADHPMFIVRRPHDLQQPLATLGAEVEKHGDCVGRWEGDSWYHLNKPSPTNRNRGWRWDGGIGSGDRSPVIGGGPSGTAGAMADVPGEAD